MAKYNLTNKAVEDLTEIWDYTFDKWSEKQADKYYEILLVNCQDIADEPNIGRNYKGIKNEFFGIRSKGTLYFIAILETRQSK